MAGQGIMVSSLPFIISSTDVDPSATYTFLSCYTRVSFVLLCPSVIASLSRATSVHHPSTKQTLSSSIITTSFLPSKWIPSTVMSASRPRVMPMMNNPLPTLSEESLRSLTDLPRSLSQTSRNPILRPIKCRIKHKRP